MKKFLLLAILSIALFSCEPIVVPPKYVDAPTQFIITNIGDKEGMVNMARYEVEIIDVNGLVYDRTVSSSTNLRFWFCDSIGKYKMGQPINFDIK